MQIQDLQIRRVDSLCVDDPSNSMTSSFLDLISANDLVYHPLSGMYAQGCAICCERMVFAFVFPSLPLNISSSCRDLKSVRNNPVPGLYILSV